MEEIEEFEEFIMLLHRHPEAFDRLLEIARKERPAAAPAGESIEDDR